MNRFPRLPVVVLALSLVLTHEASAQRRTRGAEQKKPFTAFNESALRILDSLTLHLTSSPALPAMAFLAVSSPVDESFLRDSVLIVARSQIGTRYRLGAQAPGKAFDCSGLIRYVMGALRLDLPRTAHEQAKLGREVARDTAQLRPGDLLTFGTKRRISHIGIYAGNGQVIHASTSKRRVIETSLASLGPSLLRNWRSARRLIEVVDSLPEVQ